MWAMRLLFVFALIMAGCDRTMPVTKINQIQFNENGKEIIDPTYHWQEILRNSSGQEQEKALNYLLDIIKTSEGYSRFIAAKAIINYYSKHPDVSAPKKVVQIFAKYCIRCKKRFRDDILIGEFFEKGTYEKHFDIPLDVKFSVYVDGNDLVLPQEHPSPWEIQNLKIYLDDKLVLNIPYKRLLKQYDVRLKDHLKQGNIYGNHVWRSEFELIGPGGHATKIVNKFKFQILTRDEFFKMFK